jgi:hypothetical protein
MFFIREGELGDPDRYFIGGVDSLYRMKQYKGEFNEDKREGQGVLTYTNDDSIEGNFVNGQPHGTMLYCFASTGKKDLAIYDKGYRVKFIEMKQTAAPRSTKNDANKKKSLAKKSAAVFASASVDKLLLESEK